LQEKGLKKLLSSKAVPYIAGGTVAFFWASAFPATKYGLQYYTPEALTLFRFLIAAAVLLGYCAWKKIPPPEKKDLPLFAVAGFFGQFLYMWAFSVGTYFVPSGVSSFIISSAPIFALILSITFLKERAGFIIWLGVLTSFVGLGIISLMQGGYFQLNIGTLLLLVASVSTSIFTVIQRRLVERYSAIQASTYSVAFGTLFMFIFFPMLIREIPYAPMHVNLMVVYLGIFPAALAYFFWSLALSKAKKTVYVTSFMYLVPFIASIIAFFWLGERLSILTLIGGAIIITGMVITNLKKSDEADTVVGD